MSSFYFRIYHIIVTVDKILYNKIQCKILKFLIDFLNIELKIILNLFFIKNKEYIKKNKFSKI